MKSTFSTTWKSSTQPRKQRKYTYNAPLHIKQKMLHVHLSQALRKKHSLRCLQVRKGDKIRILRGEFNKKEGKVERVGLKHGHVFVTGIERIKKDGTKAIAPLKPSNLIIIDLYLGDKRRKQKLEKRSPRVKGQESKQKREENERKTEK